jgi:hypothetical protein
MLRTAFVRSTGVLWLVSTVVCVHTQTAHAQYYPDAPPPAELPWYENMDMRLFVDAYASANLNAPKPQSGQNTYRAYDASNGFALSWIGFDAAYDPAPVGATVSLRFGPTAETYANSCLSNDTERAPCDSDIGLQFVKQGFASYRPGGPGSGLRLDLGKFDTIYGAEVAESQDNLNYTRGLLFTLGQPSFHTGLRANWEVVPELAFTAMAVNGINNSVDNNLGKSFGAQVTLSPVQELSILLGWLGGPEQDDTATIDCAAGESYDPALGRCVDDPTSTEARTETVDRGGANQLEAWRHLVDLVVRYQPVPTLELALNADYGTEGVRTSLEDDSTETRVWYGAMLAAQLGLSEVWSLAARGEYYADPDGHTTGVDEATLASATLTLGANVAEYLLIRLEGRGDFALDPSGSEPFAKSVRDSASDQFTVTLGVVASSF